MAHDIDPYSPAFQKNPYPALHRLRREAPVHFVEPNGPWLVSRYDDVAALLHDRDMRTAGLPGAVPAWARDYPLLAALQGEGLLGKDGADHTRLRKLVSRAFTPRVVANLGPRIAEIADGLLDAVEPARRMDAIRDYAAPLPLFVIGELLGIPADDRWKLQRWSAELVTLIDGTVREDHLPRADRVCRELNRYLEALFAERRTAPRDDLITRLIEARDEDHALTQQELLATCALLLVAGHETTTHLIGNGLLALLEHPGEQKRLLDQTELFATAVEEMLRYDSPIQITSRRPHSAVEFRGRRILAGQEIELLLGSANRDPERFRDPDRFDIARTDNPHLAFGSGVHACLGAALARLEAQIAFGVLLRRFPNVGPASDPPLRRRGIVLRGLTSLPVIL